VSYFVLSFLPDSLLSPMDGSGLLDFAEDFSGSADMLGVAAEDPIVQLPPLGFVATDGNFWDSSWWPLEASLTKAPLDFFPTDVDLGNPPWHLGTHSTPQLPAVSAITQGADRALPLRTKGKRKASDLDDSEPGLKFISYDGKDFADGKKRRSQEQRQSTQVVRSIGACLPCQIRRKIVSLLSSKLAGACKFCLDWFGDFSLPFKSGTSVNALGGRLRKYLGRTLTFAYLSTEVVRFVVKGRRPAATTRNEGSYMDCQDCGPAICTNATLFDSALAKRLVVPAPNSRGSLQNHQFCGQCLASDPPLETPRCSTTVGAVKASMYWGQITHCLTESHPHHSLEYISRLAKEMGRDEATFYSAIPFGGSNEIACVVAKSLIATRLVPSWDVMGHMSSNSFRKLIASHLGSGIGNTFKLLVFLSGYIHLLQKNVSVREVDDLYHVRNQAGRQILAALDSLLKPYRADMRTESERDKWRAVFLLLLGMITVLRYVASEVSLVERDIFPSAFNARLGARLRNCRCNTVDYYFGVLSSSTRKETWLSGLQCGGDRNHRIPAT
jgi:hypothetical protein